MAAGSTPTVAEIWRFPIKSVGGERLETTPVTDLGIAGDRTWGIADLDTGTVLTARRAPELLFADASLDAAGAVMLKTASGLVVESDDPGCHAKLSEWLDRDVELRPAGADGGTYEVPLDFENDADWVSWQGPGDAWHDSSASRVSLVGRGSLGRWDARRFRTNLVVDGLEPRAEDGWVDRTLTIGTARLNVTKPIDRCVIVTRPQPGLHRDLDVLRTINTEAESRLAVGALVSALGTISVGDPIAVG